MAAQKLAHEKPRRTLQATALVHEASIRLVGCEDQKSRVGHAPHDAIDVPPGGNIASRFARSPRRRSPHRQC
ncbi:MAG: ECF-type sigma factor, partial [Pirellulales bacterium]